MPISPYCVFSRGNGPIVAAAVHNGHDTRPEVEKRMKIDEDERLREEDPLTASFAQVARTQIVGLRSRFEVDLNRPRNKAVYQSRDDAWGLDVWERPPSQSIVERSLEDFDDFYDDMENILKTLVQEHEFVVVLDLHTYNHRRNGEDAESAPKLLNPEVNIGTETMDRKLWAPVIDRFIADLRAFEDGVKTLDVRENVKFKRGYFGKWIHQAFPTSVCAPAIEFRKFFMDEWTGDADLEEVEFICEALQSTLPGLREELARLKG